MLNMTNQEMFDKAVAGLASQGFKRCTRFNKEDSLTHTPSSWPHVGNPCMYQQGDRHCAWGWVDTSLTDEPGGVRALHERGVGLAKELSMCQLNFASDLQNAHDSSVEHTRLSMQENLRHLAENHGLTLPAVLVPATEIVAETGTKGSNQ